MRGFKKVLCCGVFIAAALLGADEKEHKQAVCEMLIASGVPAMLQRSFDAQLENQIKTLPELEKIRPQLQKFYREVFAYKALEPELCRLYMKHYTAEDAKAVTAFYRTPAGKKKARVDGMISAELGKLFQEYAQKKMPELQKLLQKLN